LESRTRSRWRCSSSIPLRFRSSYRRASHRRRDAGARAFATRLVAAAIACGAGFAAAPLSAEPTLPPAQSRGDVRFTVDAACFATDGPQARQEIFLQIANPEMVFEPAGEALAARIEVVFAFHDTATGRSVVERTMSAELAAQTEAEAADRAEVHILQAEFLLDPGHYELRVRLEDLNHRRSAFPLLFVRRNASGKAELSLDVPEFANAGLRLSDLEFAREIVPDEEESPFRKGDLSVVPCPERVYGLLLPELSVYLEIYDASAAAGEGQEVDLTCEIRSSQGQAVETVEERLSLHSGTRWARSVAFDLSEIPAGRYTVHARIAKSESGETATRERAFDIIWTAFSVAKDLEALIEELTPISTSADRERLKRLSSGEREVFLEEFWRSLDPTPDTPRNEALQEHYQRIRTADRAFKSRTRGSRTDRGKIYVKFGQPDEITTGFATEEFLGSVPFLARDQFDFGQEGRARGGLNYLDKAYETWTYDQRGKPLGRHDHGSSGLGLRYVFVDLSGYGDYRMIYSSESVE
jgi:GWxTD domain-containing protein